MNDDVKDLVYKNKNKNKWIGQAEEVGFSAYLSICPAGYWRYKDKVPILAKVHGPKLGSCPSSTNLERFL